MKKSLLGLPDKPFLETERRLNSLIKKPEWLETVERQQRLFDVGTPMRSMVTECSNILSCLPSHLTDLKGITAGLNTYSYLLDIYAFNPNEHIAGMQAILASVADRLSIYTPRLYETLNLPALNVLECETASKLKDAEINLPFAMHSLRIADCLQGLNSLCSSALPQIDEALASSRLLKDYASLVKRQHSQIQRDVESCAARLKVIEIATDLLQDQITSAAQYAESECDSEDVPDEISIADARTGIQFIPSYLGYTFREDTGYDLDEEFAKSMVSKILTSGKEIPQKIQYINELRMATGQTPIFKPTTKAYTAIQCLLTSFSTDNITFGCVIDSLYMLIYEGSGGAKRILEVLSDDECMTLWNIKHIRTDFRHDIEHGDEKKYLAKKQQIGCAYQAMCGKLKPSKQKDWVTAHSTLYKQVDELLQSIIDKLSNAD